MLIEKILKVCYTIAMENLNGKKYVVVTGAFGGMGREAVKSLVGSGYTVFALDKKVGNAQENVIPIEVDVSDFSSVKSAVERVKAVTNKIFAVIHYAGIYALDSLVEMSEESFKKVFEINLYGVFCVNKAFISLLDKGSKIVIVTSELAPLLPLPFTGVYAVSKTALDRYAYSLKMEVQLLDISVSVIRAGAVQTDMLGASTTALDKFIENTKLYNCNAKRFKKIVDSVETKNVSPKKIADKTLKILTAKKPKFKYTINRNKLLLLLNALPSSLQFYIIKKILK